MTQRRPRTSKTNFTLAKRTALARSRAYKWPIDAGQRLSGLWDLASGSMRTTGVRSLPSWNNPWKCWVPLVSRNLIRDVNGFLLKGADAGEEEGGMENDYWISVIRDESFIGGQRSISCAGAADKAAIYWGLVSFRAQKVSHAVKWPVFESVTRQIHMIRTLSEKRYKLWPGRHRNVQKLNAASSYLIYLSL